MSQASLREAYFFQEDENEHRDPQLVNVQRIRDCTVLSYTWGIYIIPLFPMLTDYHGRL